MQLSTRGRYAVMAMVDLASRDPALSPGEPVNLAEIAARQQLSHAYLEQLFSKLRRADLVSSARGPGGGYRLARPAAAITVADIVAAVEEPLIATRCDPFGGGCLVATPPATGTERCQTHELWIELGRQITLYLSGVSLSDVVHGRMGGATISAASSSLAASPAAASPAAASPAAASPGSEP